MVVFTKRAADVFAPTTLGGAARGAVIGEAQTWGVEVEAELAALDADKAPTASLTAETARALAAETAIDVRVDDVEESISDMEAQILLGMKPQLAAVRLLVTTDVDLSTDAEAGDTLDGLTLVAGDRFAKAYNDATGDADNGLWVVQASGAAVRATDADASAELLNGTFYVSEGTHAGETWGIKNTAAITVDTTAIVIQKIKDGTDVDAEVIGARGGKTEIGDRFNAIEARTAVPSLFIDPYFEITRDYLAVPDQLNPTHKQVHSTFRNGTFDPTHKHALGKGAWVFDNSSSTSIGFNSWFVDQGYVAGDVVSFAVALERVSGTVVVGARFFGANDNATVGSALTTPNLSSGGYHVVKFENQTIPATATGFTIYLTDTTAAAFKVLAVWGLPGALAGDRPPDKTHPVLLDFRQRKPTAVASAPTALGILPIDRPIYSRRLAMMTGRASPAVYKDNLLRTVAPRSIMITGGGGGTSGQDYADRFQNSAPTAGDGTMGFYVHDPETSVPIWRVTYDYSNLNYYGITAPSVGSGPARSVLCIGPSTTLAGYTPPNGTPADGGETTAVWINQMLYHASQNTAAVQYTFLGTIGSGAAKHEGRSGYKLSDYYQAVSGKTSAFAPTIGDYFNFANYLSGNSIATPDVVVIDLGFLLNDFSTYDSATSWISDAALTTVITALLDKLKGMIGITEDANVGSIWDVSSSIKIVICTTPPANNSQNGWTGMTSKYAMHRRWQRLAVWETLKAFDSTAMEALGVWIMPWHMTVNPTAYDATTNPTGSYPSGENIHPTHGYKKMGTDLDTLFNVAASKGWF